MRDLTFLDEMSDEAIYEVAKALTPYIKNVMPTMTDEELAAVKAVCSRPDFDADEVRTFLKKLYFFAVAHVKDFKV